jgi:hypothetical protein
LSILNSQFPTIKFTCEEEIDNKLAFLDLQVIKKLDNSLEFSVYHKPTSTMRVITSDSHCPFQYKQAAFHSMAHRLCNLPLSIQHYKNEYDYIKKVADVNGYSEKMVDNIIRKHARKAKRKNLSTMQNVSNVSNEKRKVSMGYTPIITNKLKSIFNKHDMMIVYKNNNKLIDLLGSTKDKRHELKQSGINRSKCSQCEAVYIGQTKRSVEKRFKEHLKAIEQKHKFKSAFAAHALESKHLTTTIEDVKLLKRVNEERSLDAYECVLILNTENTVNLDNGNIESNLFSLINKRQ